MRDRRSFCYCTYGSVRLSTLHASNGTCELVCMPSLGSPGLRSGEHSIEPQPGFTQREVPFRIPLGIILKRLSH